MSELRSFDDNAPGREDDAAGDWTNFERDLVFVALPFDASGDAAFAAIAEECARLGLRAARLDRNAGAGVSIKHVAEMVRRAEFLIFDLTRQQPNVFYGLGYAHGVGNEALDILSVVQEGAALEFDIAPLRVKTYRSIDQLRGIVAAELSEMIRQTRR